jgi:hypothetical protein
MQGVLSEQSGKIAEGALFKDVQATPEGLTKFLSERAAQDTAVGQFVEYANRALGNVGSIEELQQYYNFMASLASRIPPELAAAGLNAVGRKIANFWEKYRIVDSQYSRDYTTRENRSRFIQNFLLAANYGIGTVRINAKRKDFFDIERINDNGLEAINKLASEIRSDTTVAENLLSVLQESLANQIAIEEHTRKTAENTKLQLEKDRGDAFVDIAAGGLRQQDSFLAFSPITLGAQMQSVLLSSLALQTATKTDNQLLAELVGLNKDMRLLLAEIALNTNRSAGNFGGMSETELLALLSDFKSKS